MSRCGKLGDGGYHGYCRITDKEIMYAREKPKGCSRRRWRIELARRRDAARFAEADFPDTL